MSKELSSFEKMGGTYTEVNGIFYPNIVSEKEEQLDVGKYGTLWIKYMEENHTDRYRHLMRMGSVQRKAYEVNEEAYEMLEHIMNQYLEKHKPISPHSTTEKWQIMEQAKRIAEEEIVTSMMNQSY